MSLQLSRFLSTKGIRIPTEDKRRLLLYAACAQAASQKLGIPISPSWHMGELLPALCRSIPHYEIKDAAFALSAATPWDRLQENQDLAWEMENLREYLIHSRCATTE